MIKNQSIFRYILYWVLITISAILLSACSTKSIKDNTHAKMDNITIKSTFSEKISQYDNNLRKIVKNQNIRSRIMAQYANWKGVRYRFGGSTKNGIDCSAFVQRTFREQFGLKIPRSTFQQQKIGKAISRYNLRIGDLVLFRIGPRNRHVGIYIGNNQFVHVSASNGVMISNLNTPYWKKYYNKARRILVRS